MKPIGKLARRYRCFAFAMLLLGFPAVAGAELHILLVRDDSGVAREAAEALTRSFERLGWSPNEVVIGVDRPAAPVCTDGSQAVVALGPLALQSLGRVEGCLLVGALVSRAWVDNEPGLRNQEMASIIVLDQPEERWARLLVLAFPDRARVGVLVSDEKRVRLLASRLLEKRHSLASETVVLAGDLMPALEKLMPRIDVLLALPDPVAHNRHTVQPLLLTTYRARIPVVGYSESYLQAGSAIALYSSVDQISDQVVETLQRHFDGRVTPAVQAPKYFTVGINGAVARALGLSLPSVFALQEQLRGADQ